MKSVKLVWLDEEVPVKYKLINFSGGELHPQIQNVKEIEMFSDSKKTPPSIYIENNNLSSKEIIELSLLINAIKNIVGDKIYCMLKVNYLPYARQDRVCSVGDAFSLKVFFSLLNAAGVDTVSADDVHSEAAFKIANDMGVKLYNQSQWLGFERVYNGVIDSLKYGEILIVAPDKGALPKVKKLYQVSGVSKEDIPYFDKIRNPATGEITGMALNANYEDLVNYKKIILVDDICDGGRTFIEAAKILTNTYKIPKENLELYVTHGIFSKGIGVVEEWFGRVSCFNDLRKEESCEGVVIT